MKHRLLFTEVDNSIRQAIRNIVRRELLQLHAQPAAPTAFSPSGILVLDDVQEAMGGTAIS